ncbi:MAG: S9 family peptidase [Acidobacteria bacterium]|nr:S9 family peptidase [Acidobacteriota bacterium]MCW5970981.1 S9 family peptidase [Blastocatellales bacterium]
MPTIRRLGPILLLLALASALQAQTAARRPLTLDDLPRFREVRDPQCSPDGKWVAYVVSTTDVKEDKSVTHIWITGVDGTGERQLTTGQEGESSPRWSPDGRYLAFTSSRPGKAKGNQVWLLDRNGGEALQLTEVKGRLQGYEWSPDSRRLALVVGDPDPEAEAAAAAAESGGKPKPPQPIVIDRYKYKQDGQGYLRSNRHSYVYLFDIETGKLDRLTKGNRDEAAPSWSPDGKWIAFLSDRGPDPDRDPSNQIFIAEAKPEAVEKAITPRSSRIGRSRPEWSPDGKWIAYLEGEDKKWGAYSMNHLAVVPSDGSGAPRLVAATEALDRGVGSPQFTADGRAMRFLVTDDRSVYPARVSFSNGETGARVEKLLEPPVVVSSWDASGDCSCVLSGGDEKYTEVYSFKNGELRQLSRRNDALMSELQIAPTERVSFRSKDGTEVHGLLTKPLGYVAGTRAPLLLRIHGGPNAQDQHTFSLERQYFAANGYAVLAVNYRGSAGRGQKFSRAIAAHWGHYEVEDLHAGVDHVIKMGVADPDRLGVGGWSYGGILTDYLIASDARFKAATSGAGTAFTVSFYGSDQYILQYDNEIGPPWNPKSWEIYQKLAYPFLKADRIKTPTLFLCGEKDFNVPIAGSEQMYQALRSLGIDTQLIIYPNQNHGITRPSYVRDRYERYLAWYDKYLKQTTREITEQTK